MNKRNTILLWIVLGLLLLGLAKRNFHFWNSTVKHQHVWSQDKEDVFIDLSDLPDLPELPEIPALKILGFPLDSVVCATLPLTSKALITLDYPGISLPVVFQYDNPMPIGKQLSTVHVLLPVGDRNNLNTVPRRSEALTIKVQNCNKYTKMFYKGQTVSIEQRDKVSGWYSYVNAKKGKNHLEYKPFEFEFVYSWSLNINMSEGMRKDMMVKNSKESLKKFENGLIQKILKENNVPLQNV